MQTDFSVSSEQLFAPITSATKDVKTLTEVAIYGNIPERERAKKAPLLDTLEKIAAEIGQTKESLKALPADIITVTRQQQRKEGVLEQIRQKQYDKEQEELEKETQEDEEDQPQGTSAKGEEQDQPQGDIGRWNTPENTLAQHVLAEIREIKDDEKLVDFTARRAEKNKRDAYIIGGRESKITDTDECSRMVFLTNRRWTRLPPGDNTYRDFRSKVRSKKDKI